jgi:TIR domain
MAPDAASAPPVLISYSRKDYYFAESLAFHLLRRGVAAWMDVKDLIPGGDWERGLQSAVDAAATVVLVVSPNSMASDRVRDEWQRALGRGCRIVLVRFRGAKLPAELQQCESVDFRRSFRRALRRLMTYFPNTQSAVPAARAAHPGGLAWTPPLPPWIAFIALTLVVPLITYFAAVISARNDEPGDRYLLWMMAPVAVVGLSWFFAVTFLRRRMGMTRLALCLATLAIVIALPIVKYFVGDESSLDAYGAAIAQSVAQYWRQGALLCAVPLVGLISLLFIRPEDLLRWTPTGKAWTAYRIGHVANAAFGRAEVAFQLEQLKIFALAHDPVDAPLAEYLRVQLRAVGASEAAAGVADATPVLLLTSCTQLAWIDAQAQPLRRGGVTIVGTGIALPSNLDWLWRRQWIDFRGWDLRRVDRALALPQVPDAVTDARPPASVSRVHHVLCAAAAIIFAFAGALMPRDDEPVPIFSIATWMAYATMAAGVWWALSAHRLVKRTRSAPSSARDFRIAWIAAAVVASVDIVLLAPRIGTMRVVLVVVFLLCAVVWLARGRSNVDFWLPAIDVSRVSRRNALGQSRNWRTLLWTFVYLFGWMWTLGFTD